MDSYSATPKPKLPSYHLSPPASLAAALGGPPLYKRQTLQYRNGYAVPLEPQPAAGGAGAAASPASALAAACQQDDWQLLPTHLTTYAAATANVSVAPSNKKPKFVEYDKKVLRFFGYFVEAVPDSREEDWRTRKVVVLLYLEDDTLQVTEPSEANSGLPQGTFIRRHRIPKAGGGFLGLADLTVGSSVTIYGRRIELCDADAFTHSFAASRGQEQGPARPYPLDPIQQYRAEKSVPSGLKPTDEDSPSQYAEALLGREPINRELKQFLEHSKQVLRFYCIHDDRKALYGDRRPFKLHYFLEDNTVEIMEMLEANSGTDPFPAFLKRGPLPKGTAGTGGVEVVGAKPAAIYKPEDLRVGGFVSVHGRDFFLYACDDFTHKWYKENLGLSDAELAAVDVTEAKKPLPQPAVPAYNGYGSFEDSLQNCLKLVPTAPKRDMVKLLNKERIVLRFRCRLLEGEGYRLSSIDKERRFVLSFFAGDDTLSIFEPPVLNSGVTGGKYLERAKARKPGAGLPQYYTERDLYCGARISLAGRVFELLEADAFTESYQRMAGGGGCSGQQ